MKILQNSFEKNQNKMISCICVCLWELTFKNDVNKNFIKDLDGIPLMIEILENKCLSMASKKENSQEKTQKRNILKNICGTLKNLVNFNSENKILFRQEGGIDLIIELMKIKKDSPYELESLGLEILVFQYLRISTQINTFFNSFCNQTNRRGVMVGVCARRESTLHHRKGGRWDVGGSIITARISRATVDSMRNNFEKFINSSKKSRNSQTEGNLQSVV